MAKRKSKRKSSRKKGINLTWLTDQRGKKARQGRQSMLILLKIMAIVFVVALIPIGISFLTDYVDVEAKLARRHGLIKLVDAPVWVSEQLKNKIYSAATAGGEDLALDEEVAASVQHNIATFVPWIDNVKVQVTADSLLVSGQWRKPIAMVQLSQKYYVDADLVALDYLPVVGLNIVEITGIATNHDPALGVVWDRADLEAAIDIIYALNRMDERVCPNNPLLAQIRNIEVSNFQGRYNSAMPHITMYTIDGTEIIWGSEFGQATEHLEVPDKEKIGRLYNFYKSNGTLLNVARYINLCDPQDYVPQPIDEL